MVDPTSDLGEDVQAADAPTCVTCEAALTDQPSHRVVTWIDDGQVQTAHFCDERCRMGWDGG